MSNPYLCWLWETPTSSKDPFPRKQMSDGFGLPLNPAKRSLFAAKADGGQPAPSRSYGQGHKEVTI